MTWPAMTEHAFAYTAPIWKGEKGSTEPVARWGGAANDPLRALAVAEKRLIAAYEGSQIPKLRAHFAEARVTLSGLAK